MSNFDSDYQARHDGPLTPAIRQRVTALKEKDRAMTNASIALNFGISQAFLGKICRSDDPASIRTRHIKSIIMALEDLEERAGINNDTKKAPNRNALSLEELIRAITDKGFNVTFSPAHR